jgi:voltage-gated potassium channel
MRHAPRRSIALAWKRYLPGWLRAMWPQWPLGAALALSGALNIMGGLQYNLAPLARIQPLSDVSQSLGVLGGSTQVMLGVGLVLVGIGLLWRLHTAWAFAVLLLAITVGVNLTRGQWGANLYLPGLLLLALLGARRFFTRRTILANYIISLVGVLAIMAYGTFGAYLLGAGFQPPIHTIFTALYYTIVTLSTVGYGDIVPTTPDTRLFAVSLLVVGLSTFATVVASMVGPAISEELTRIFKVRGTPMKLKNHVILVGEGGIARNTAEELAGRGIPFVQVIAADGDPASTEHPVIRGDSSEDPVLREAGIDDAQMVIAARDDDGENAFIALAAKDLNPSIKVLAVASSARAIRRLGLARADIVFAPTVVGSRLLANLIEGAEIPSEFRDLLQGRPDKR